MTRCVLIRPPRPEDAGGLALAARDLADQYAAHEPERFHVPDQEALVAWLVDMIRQPRPSNAFWVVAEVEGQAVGDVYADLREPMADAALQPQLDVGRRRVHLDYLAVRARWRGRGIGGMLLEHVEEWAREHGAELITAETNVRTNLGAVEFYESHGYERQSVILRKHLH